MTAPANIRAELSFKRGAFALDVAFDSAAAVTALFGPSGAGKTTLLHLISGILRPDAGRVAVQGRVLVDTEAAIDVPPHRRRMGLVFQDGQLFPHLTVRQNISFGRRFAPRDWTGADEGAVVATIGISDLLDRRPHQLSGGERQRVALARAILSAPRMLLLDEPLASLDDGRRREILSLIERIRDEFSMPIIYVTHRADEVRRLASHVIRLERGKIVGAGAPDAVLAAPGSSV